VENFALVCVDRVVQMRKRKRTVYHASSVFALVEERGRSMEVRHRSEEMNANEMSVDACRIDTSTAERKDNRSACLLEAAAPCCEADGADAERSAQEGQAQEMWP